jgi:Spy/CpxP family protein refolding chaperone
MLRKVLAAGTVALGVLGMSVAASAATATKKPVVHHHHHVHHHKTVHHHHTAKPKPAPKKAM